MASTVLGIIMIVISIVYATCLIIDYVKSNKKSIPKRGICQPIIKGDDDCMVWICPSKEEMQKPSNKRILLDFCPMACVEKDGTVYGYDDAIDGRVKMKPNQCIVNHQKDGKLFTIMDYKQALDMAFKED